MMIVVMRLDAAQVLASEEEPQGFHRRGHRGQPTIG